MTGVMYYERVFKDLKDKAKIVFDRRAELVKLNKETAVDQSLFRKKAKELKEGIVVVSKDLIEKNKTLLNNINKTQKDGDWEKLLDDKLKISALELKKEMLLEKHRKARFAHYKKMAPFVKQKKLAKKDILVCSEEILNKIKNS